MPQVLGAVWVLDDILLTLLHKRGEMESEDCSRSESLQWNYSDDIVLHDDEVENSMKHGAGPGRSGQAGSTAQKQTFSLLSITSHVL
jgi:hypothetical protein